ncbi:hypothetical protein RJ640_029084 [Escallonia rubra]|uniref:Domain X domain-containing protein n=1 Tax=Escallonia rubra TaxID=112253 RepID=A0AA88RD07_9ASTE|nr:hypothetical protein RJ640_029084 [Escallonia rubra]
MNKGTPASTKNNQKSSVDEVHSIVCRWFSWYSLCDNFNEVKLIVSDQVRKSCIRTLAAKYRIHEADIENRFDSELSRLPVMQEIDGSNDEAFMYGFMDAISPSTICCLWNGMTMKVATSYNGLLRVPSGFESLESALPYSASSLSKNNDRSTIEMDVSPPTKNCSLLACISTGYSLKIILARYAFYQSHALILRKAHQKEDLLPLELELNRLIFWLLAIMAMPQRPSLYSLSRSILMYPSSPQLMPHEFLINQYFLPSSVVPYPTAVTP